MNSRTLVSIILPVYNGEKFVKHSIDSVFKQTNDQWQLIVVNDGSTDSTAEIVKEFDDPRIIYIYQENLGLSAARNSGIRNSRAEIIALLDSDDLWEPEFLEKMMGLIERHPDAAAVYCGFQYIDAKGQYMGVPSYKVVPPETVYKKLICGGNWLAPCAVVFRRRLAQEVGLFDESLMAVEDADLWIRLSALHHFIGLPEVLVKYRRHDSNMSKDPHRMVTAKYQCTVKMFGSPEGDVSSWSNLKRCDYEEVFQYGARGYLASGIVEDSADNFQQLLEISPDSALSMGVWRGLVRAYLPDEQRNNLAAHPDWKLAERDIFRLLRELSTRTNDSVALQKLCSRLKGSAYLALAEEANQANELRRASEWLWRSAKSCPYILFSRPYWGTVVRSIIRMGKRNIT